MDMSRRKILEDNSQLGPYPLEKLPHVDKITVDVHDEEIRFTQKDHITNRMRRGEFGEFFASQKNGQSFRVPMAEAIRSTLPHIAAFPENPVAEQKAPLPDDPHIIARHIKKYTYFIGADQVGICKVPLRAVYKDKANFEDFDYDPEKYPYAIVFLLRKDPSTCAASYGNEWVDDSCSWAVYQRCAVIGVTLARYIRSLGYNAIQSVCTDYVTIMSRLIAEAGLGEFSRHGIVVNPFIGSSFKAAAVLTDLPMEIDGPVDFGLQDYCSKCQICAEQCPSKAVTTGGKTEYHGSTTWELNRMLCVMYNSNEPYGDVCQRCTQVCPFNRPEGTPQDWKDWDGNLDYLYKLVEEQRKFNEEHDYLHPLEETGKWWFPFRKNEEGVLEEAREFEYSKHEARMKALREKKKKEAEQK